MKYRDIPHAYSVHTTLLQLLTPQLSHTFNNHTTLLQSQRSCQHIHLLIQSSYSNHTTLLQPANTTTFTCIQCSHTNHTTLLQLQEHLHENIFHFELSRSENSSSRNSKVEVSLWQSKIIEHFYFTLNLIVQKLLTLLLTP